MTIPIPDTQAPREPSRALLDRLAARARAEGRVYASVGGQLLRWTEYELAGSEARAGQPQPRISRRSLLELLQRLEARS